jgi:hypothetical protein
MKLRSGSIDDALNELQLSLGRARSAAATITLRQANRQYRELHRHYLRLLRAAERGAFVRSEPRRARADGTTAIPTIGLEPFNLTPEELEHEWERQ